MQQNQINLIELDRMLDAVATDHWAASTAIFPESFCKALAQECHKLHDSGEFTKASIGHGATKGIHAEVRGDFTYWLTGDANSQIQSDFLQALQAIQQTLNQSFYLGIKSFETHFALYPPGGGYDKHIDNHRGSGSRKITFILYLNENWQEGHGGELSLYEPKQEDLLLAQVEPRLGTFVLFRSDLFPHQVEKSLAPRLSLTGWFRNDST